MYKNYRNDSLLREEKLRLLDESLMLIERLKKMQALGATAKSIGINPHIIIATRIRRCA